MIARDAGRGFGAGVLLANSSANSVQSVAGFVIGAILVVMTDRGDARDARIALSTRRTDALSSMGHRAALGTAAAHDVAAETGSDAVVVAAGLVVRTVVVRLTFGYG